MEAMKPRWRAPTWLMRRLSVAIAAVVLSLCAIGAATAAANGGDTSSDAAFHAAEAWAFPKSHSRDPSLPERAKAPKPDLNEPMHVPGSTRTYTRAQMDTGFAVADWFPQDHPPMPHIVAFGRKPAYACAACHKPDGEGYPASASLAGLPAAYLREQLQAFRDGQRDKHGIMPKEARSLDLADERAVIAYFSKLKPASQVRVVETASVPKTHWDYHVLAPDHDGASEPIGERIIEMSNDQALYALVDERVGFTAYVPPGSIEAGARIAAHSIGTAPSCESCHGAKLQGVGDIPYLAGRSPTYIARELILFREGKRTDPSAAPMRTEVSRLTLPEMIDVAAYAASRKP